MDQLAWTLHHHISEGRMGGVYHVGMPTQRTNQLFLKPQPSQSSDQMFTQMSQKVKAYVTQIHIPLAQLIRRTNQKAMSHTRMRKIH
jgi:hypothetical protein